VVLQRPFNNETEEAAQTVGGGKAFARNDTFHLRTNPLCGYGRIGGAGRNSRDVLH
jgi:hypothetical protein